MKKISIFVFFVLYLSILAVCGQQSQSWDSGRYIRVDEIKTDMPAYCLSVTKGEVVDKFDLKILSVIKNAQPGRDMILVISPDERLKNTGAVHGFSGSPVYIDGRLAGAMSAGWDGALEPLYLVTPIEDMLPIGQTSNVTDLNTISCIDPTAPLNISAICKKAESLLIKSARLSGKLPLSTNLSAQACQAIAQTLEPMGLVPLAGGPASGDSDNTDIVPGGVLAVPVCSGDIKMSVVGTATEVVGDKVYGFGHAFTSIGAVELPMSAGTVHAIVATRSNSFKLASPGQIVGTLRFDQNTGVVGFIGPKPEMIDLELKVRRFDDTQERVYHCKIAKHRELTPVVLRSVIMGASLDQGDLPPEHNIRYQCSYQLTNGRELKFGNFSSLESVQAPASELFALTATLMNNPFQSMQPARIAVEIDIQPQHRVVSLWETRLSNTTVAPGQTLQVFVKVKEFRSDIREFVIDFPIPQDCPQGRYVLQISGVDGYQSFLTKTAPQKFVVTDARSLLEGLQRVLNIANDRIYVCVSTTQSGISFRNAELASLPQTKTILLTDTKRIQPTTPYQNFIEASIGSDFVLSGAAVMDLIVEKNP